jgi:hypothetical protein
MHEGILENKIFVLSCFDCPSFCANETRYLSKEGSITTWLGQIETSLVTRKKKKQRQLYAIVAGMMVLPTFFELIGICANATKSQAVAWREAVDEIDAAA